LAVWEIEHNIIVDFIKTPHIENNYQCGATFLMILSNIYNFLKLTTLPAQQVDFSLK